ncbi:MAG: CHAD domain-containing protein [Nitrospinota bacterium]|nr:CHAD domain-containing protein [Nitrospinota bacterium]
MNKSTAVTKILDKALSAKIERFEKEMEKCRRHFSEKATHNLRISLRRLISAIEVTGAILGMVKTSKPRKMLKQWLDLFGQLRDVQVKLLAARKLKETYPGVEPYAAGLKAREKDLIEAIGKEARKMKTPKIKKGIKPALKKIRDLPLKEFKQEKYLVEAINFVDVKHHDVIARAQRISKSNLKTIHETRLAFKKFRYSVEALAPVLGGVTREKLDQMSKFQRMMGDINDIQALHADIARFARTKDGKELGLREVLEELDEQLKNAIGALIANLGALDGFWAGYESQEAEGDE